MKSGGACWSLTMARRLTAVAPMYSASFITEIRGLFLGILRFRDYVFPDRAQHEKFDEAYEFVFTTVSNMRANAKKIAEMIEAH